MLDLQKCRFYADRDRIQPQDADESDEKFAARIYKYYGGNRLEMSPMREAARVCCDIEGLPDHGENCVYVVFRRRVSDDRVVGMMTPTTALFPRGKALERNREMKAVVIDGVTAEEGKAYLCQIIEEKDRCYIAKPVRGPFAVVNNRAATKEQRKAMVAMYKYQFRRQTDGDQFLIVEA